MAIGNSKSNVCSVTEIKGNKIKFNLVVNTNFDKNVESFIIDYWFEQLQYPIIVNTVNKISLTKSGKRKFIINE